MEDYTSMDLPAHGEQIKLSLIFIAGFNCELWLII